MRHGSLLDTKIRKAKTTVGDLDLGPGMMYLGASKAQVPGRKGGERARAENQVNCGPD